MTRMHVFPLRTSWIERLAAVVRVTRLTLQQSFKEMGPVSSQYEPWMVFGHGIKLDQKRDHRSDRSSEEVNRYGRGTWEAVDRCCPDVSGILRTLRAQAMSQSLETIDVGSEVRTNRNLRSVT